jgi:hypothetical protein
VEEISRKVLGIALTVFFLVMLVTPAVAKSPKKIPVTTGVNIFDMTLPTEFWVTAGNVAHGRGDTITAEWSVTGEGVSLEGTASEVGIFNANLNNPGVEVMTMFGSVPAGTGIRRWDIVVDVGEGSTFEGSLVSRGIQWVYLEFPFAGASALWDGVQHAVLHGTGDYQGWTLVWETVRVEGLDVSKEAYILIP